ncbi:MAG: HlyC/CorC family transporter [Chloroflexi bacterium]|nr:HlyC/CorC family transporter [Chloroflexota bacterium]
MQRCCGWACAPLGAASSRPGCRRGQPTAPRHRPRGRGHAGLPRLGRGTRPCAPVGVRLPYPVAEERPTEQSGVGLPLPRSPIHATIRPASPHQVCHQGKESALVFVELAIILLLIVINGVLAMSEIAIVSARQSSLQQRAAEGDKGALMALALADEPTTFLSTVQIGITLVGILAGAFGGATLAEPLAQALRAAPLLAPYSGGLAVGLVVLGITYLSLVIGELVPKRLALNNAEQVAATMAPTMRILARVTAPAVRLLSLSTDGVLRLLRAPAADQSPVSEEEIKILLQQGRQVGIFEAAEEQMVQRVFRLADRRVSMLMTPRPEVVWLDVDDPPEKLVQKIRTSGFSRFPVAEGALDHVVGMALTKDLLAQRLAGKPLDLRAALRPALFVPEGLPALEMLERFREERVKAALVMDEYGGLQGLVTLTDVVEAILGDLPEADEHANQTVVRRGNGDFLLDGRLPIDEFKELFGVREMPEEGERFYETLAGFVLHRLGHVPEVGERFECMGLRFEVLDMDGLRVDRVLVAQVGEPSDPV